jgi:predicted nuclease of predicted toxin-antitoxin system
MADYLIDANLPRWFSLWSGSEYAFVHDIGPHWSDSQIWQYAAAHRLTVVTKDADFSDRALSLDDDGPRVIHIRVGNLTMRELHAFLSSRWADVCRMSETCRLVQVYRDRIEAIG